MEASKKIKIGDFYCLQIGVGYSQEAVQDIKSELVALHGVKLVFEQPDESLLSIKCQNFKSKVCCLYSVQFKVEFRQHGSHQQRLLRLQSYILNHHQSCRDQEQASFLKNMHYLNKISPTLARFVRIRHQNNDPIRTPCHAIQQFAKDEELPENFYVTGVKNADYRRKLKKKFDNIFAEARSKCTQNKNKSLVNQSKQQKLYSYKNQQQYDPQAEQITKQTKLRRKIRKF